MNVSMSLESLIKQHYPIDITYKPILNKLQNEDFEEIIERIVGIFKELSSKGTPSLFVCDTLAMYAICTATERQFRPRGIIRDTYIKQAFPAASIMTIRRHKIDEQTGFELLPDYLSPITHIAGCTRINPTYLHNDENEDIVRQ
uniref:Tyrosine-protein phosphatase domain-containing protein n=1 Tax=Ascaris lumbricoides TaxID=6252 RepID=A0A0M3IGR5_ASCLU